jgi:hypothetical protein
LGDIMNRQQSLEQLWNSAAAVGPTQNFEPAALSALPEAAQRYLKHAIAPGTTLATAVRLQMRGEIKLKRWYPFSAEQVIHWNRGMIWQATVRMWGMTMRGSDSFLDGQGGMDWKLFGILPVINASGPDVTRSAAGRANIESLWLPSVLLREDVKWTASDQNHPHARFSAHTESAELDYTIDESGELKTVYMPRWGNPDKGNFRYVPFGALIEEEQTFGGYTIPARVRVGWNFGTNRFEPEGEFFRATIDQAAYR